jgi:hypothetical protein
MPSLAAGGKSGVISNLLALAFVAGLLPYYMGKTFLEPLSLVAFAALSVFLVASLITRSFAGKEALLDLRELAAGGTSGEAMALGKAAAATLRGWSFAIAMVLVGLITVNLAHWQGRALLPARSLSGDVLALSLAASWLVALAGALISLQSPTAKSALDRLTIAIGIAVLVAADTVWFYPGELLEVKHVAWIAVAVLVIGAGIVFQSLRKRMASVIAAGALDPNPAIKSFQ